MRSVIRSRENNSVSDDATASSRLRLRTMFRYSFTAKRVAGRDASSGADLVGVEPSGFREFQPALDAAFAGGVAVVVNHALAPGAAKDRIGAARENNRILDRDRALVVVAIQGPGLQLAAAEAAFVHHQMKRMLVVIAFLAYGTQLRAQLVEREQGCVFLLRGPFYSSNCHPSSAISHPASRTWRYSGPALIQHGIRVVDM